MPTIINNNYTDILSLIIVFFLLRDAVRYAVSLYSFKRAIDGWVVGKRQGLLNAWHYLTIENQDGRIEICVSSYDYGHMIIGDKVSVEFKGSRLVSFQVLKSGAAHG